MAGLIAGAGGGAAVALTTDHGSAKPRFVISRPTGPTIGTLVVAGRLPELAGTARAYLLSSEPAAGAIEGLANALGVHAPVQADAGGWVVRQGNRLVRVQRAPGLAWFLSTFGGPCQIVPDSEVLPTIPPSGPTDCPGEPGTTPATTTPTTRADVEPLALRALIAAGVGDYYAVLDTGGGRVTVSPVVERRPVAGLDWSATVNDNDDITAASGFLAQAQPMATYRLVGTTVGLERLQRTPEVPRLAVANVTLGLLRAGEYLVPAYIFEFEGGGTRAVPAVEDRYLQ